MVIATVATTGKLNCAGGLSFQVPDSHQAIECDQMQLHCPCLISAPFSDLTPAGRINDRVESISAIPSETPPT